MTDEELEEIERKHQIDETHGAIDPDKDHLIASVKQLKSNRDEWAESYKTRTESHVAQAKKLFAEIKELRAERDEARADATAARLWWDEAKAQNRRLLELARYAKSYGEYHLEKFYDGDPEGIAAGPRKLSDLADRALDPQP